MRSQKSVLNATVSFVLQILTVLFAFISRTVFIHVLGEEYLGVNGLFSNILTLLSMADMGLGAAIVYAMYKPMAENDQGKLNALLGLYAKIYTVIGIVIIMLGLAITPFLEYFTSGVTFVENIRLAYILYVFNTGISYFFVYKSSIINVAQDGYIVKVNSFVFKVFGQLVQIAVLFVYRNFILYCVTMVIFTLLTNLSISYIANRKYPFIRAKTETVIDEEELQVVKKNCLAMVCHKIGDIVVNGTDNLLIAKFVSVISVGLYSNYLMIISSVLAMVTHMFASVIASIGNFAIESNPVKAKTLFENIFFINSLIAGFCAACLFNLLNPFITVWIGERFLFDTFTVSLLVGVFYVQVIRQTSLTFRNAYGLFWNDRYKPLVEAFVNLTVSVVLGNLFGMNGIFAGTLISLVGICFWVEPYIVYKNVFKTSVISYFVLNLKYFAVNIIGISIGYIVIKTLNVSGFLGIMVNLFVVVAAWGFVFIAFFFSTEEFKWLVEKGRYIIFIIKKRNKIEAVK